jgi:hypothetical protein
VAALRQQPVGEITVVVARDGPVDAPPGLRLLHIGRAHFARAANAGLRATPRGSVLLLNDDTEPQPGLLQRLGEAAAAGGEGIYQPALLLDDGSGRIDNLGHRWWPDGANLARGRGRPWTAAEALRRATTVGAFSGAAVLFTGAARERVGLFDEDFEAFGEDADLSLRAARLGIEIRLVPAAVVLHRLGASYGRAEPWKVFQVERNRVRAALRSLPALALLGAPAWTVARYGALGLGALRGEGLGAAAGPTGGLAALAGGLAGLASAPDALQKRSADRPQRRAGELDMLRWLWAHRAGRAELWAEQP